MHGSDAQPWWRDAVAYQVYPRSFQDSDGDGEGDLRGIAARLDHIRDLGADAVWLSPVYPSPMADGGYDVAEVSRLQKDLSTAMVYATHDQTEAMTLGDRVAVMRSGVLQQVDTPRALYNDPVNIFVAASSARRR